MGHPFAHVHRGGPLTGIRAAWRDGTVAVAAADLPELLAVVPLDALGLGGDLVTTAGSWERLPDAARFTPRFAAVPGTRYVVLGRDDAAAPWRELARVGVPESVMASSTVVEAIDPGVDRVPANLLRFTVTFSSEMEEGSAAGHIHLLDESGVALPGMLFDQPPELWDRGHRRLTVLIEPGRIKRGLQPNLQAGAPLTEGSTVTLVVDSDIRDAEGLRLASGACRTYRVGPAIRSRVDPARWEVRWPETGRDPLAVRFDRPLDRALVQRCLRVLDGDGHPVPGDTQFDQNAQLWTFTPAAEADLKLRIDTRLEDLAGNSVRRVFDRDLSNSADDGIDDAVIVLSR